MAEERGIGPTQLVENIDTRGKIASLFSQCFGGLRKQEGEKQIHPLSVRRLNIATRLLSEPSIEALNRVARIAQEYVAFQPKFDAKLIPSALGDQTRMRMMESFDDILRLQPSSWALKQACPKYFRYKLATKGFLVREKVQRTDKKQLFYAMLDSSSSMQEGERIYKLIAILMNRLRAVVRNEAMLAYSFFDAQVHEEMRVSEPEEARQTIASLHHSIFVGDDTDINLAIREGIMRIKQIVFDTGADRPELIIVTDGDNYINVTPDELEGIVLHCFVVEGSNEELMELARKTGGVALDEL
jgi:uncharacterized protein with von Willebrand factor type A (vWA) domain